MRALEVLGLCLGILASLVVVTSAPALGRMYRWAREQHRRNRAVDDLIEMHDWPANPPPAKHLPYHSRRAPR